MLGSSMPIVIKIENQNIAPKYMGVDKEWTNTNTRLVSDQSPEDLKHFWSRGTSSDYF